MADDEELSKIAYEHRVYQMQLQEMRRQADSAQSALAEVAATAEGIRSLPQVGGKGTLMGLGSGVFTAVSLRDAQAVLVEIGAGVFVEKTAGEAVQVMEERGKRLEEVLQKLGKSLDEVSRRLGALEERAEALG